MDGFGSVVQTEASISAREDIKKLLGAVKSFADAPGLILIAHSGAIDRKLTSEIVRLLEASDEQLVNADSAYQVLNCGAYVASTTRDERLAALVISRCVRSVPPDASSASFLSLLLLAFRACAVFTDRAEYYRQIDAVAVRFAYLASGVNASEMASAMEALSQREIRMTSAVARAVVILEAVERN
jgi:hypothetical protein